MQIITHLHRTTEVVMPGPRDGEKANSKVKSYFLTPEEHAKYKAMPAPPKPSITVIPHRKERESKAPKKKLKRDEYLQLVRLGMSDAEIAKMAGWTQATLQWVVRKRKSA